MKHFEVKIYRNNKHVATVSLSAKTLDEARKKATDLYKKENAGARNLSTSAQVVSKNPAARFKVGDTVQYITGGEPYKVIRVFNASLNPKKVLWGYEIEGLETGRVHESMGGGLRKVKIKNPAQFLLVDANLKVVASGNDYDRLQERADRHNESDRVSLNNYWTVISQKDFEITKATAKNGQDAYKDALHELKSDPHNNYLQREVERVAVRLGISKSTYQRDIQSVIRSTRKNDGASDFKEFQKQRLSDLSKMFQGEANGEKHRVLCPDIMPKNAYRLGHLALMKVKGINGKTFDIVFDDDAFLSGDLRNNLWACGKGAIVTGIARPRKGFLRELGKLTQIDYITAKKHIEGGKLVRFWHPLGEVDKEYPTLYIDVDGFPIIHGGGYDVWNVGIVN